MKRVLLAVLACGVCLSISREARAGGVIIYNSGEDFFPAGPVPESVVAEYPELKNAKAGYGCDIFGFFWAYFTIHNCRPAIEVAGEPGWAEGDVAEAIKAKYPQSAMQIGFWTKHGRWVLIGLLVVIVGGGILRKVRGSSDDDEESSSPQT